LHQIKYEKENIDARKESAQRKYKIKNRLIQLMCKRALVRLPEVLSTVLIEDQRFC